MAFSTPKVDYVAADGFAYTDINKTNENIRVLAGGDNTLPLSTDAATANALAKRDADGDIAFRDVAARDIAARDIAASGNVTVTGALSVGAIACTAGNYDLASDSGGATTSGSYVEVTRKLYCPRTGTIRVKFTASGLVTCRIYKNGIAVGTVCGDGSYSEDLAVTKGDYFSIYAYTYMSTAYITNFALCVGEIL